MLGEHNYHRYEIDKKIVRKQVPVHSLRVGMYVVELDRPWVETPFLFQGFVISSEEEIDQLAEHCDYVFIDVNQKDVTFKGADHRGPRKRTYQRDIHKVPIEKALPEAVSHYSTAKRTVDTTLSALRLSQEIDTHAVKTAVRECVKSVIKNPNAMMWLAQIKNKDDYTAEHSLRVSVLSVALGRELELLEKELEDLGVAAMLHDVGKVKIPQEILNKEGSLNNEEYEIIKTHADAGRSLLMSKSDVPPKAIDVAYNHHERLDGKGYPRGVTAERIPFYAKIVSVVDAFDAITSDRIYSKAKSSLEALRILYDCRGTQFDDEIVRAFVRLVGVYPPGNIVELSTGHTGIILSCPPRNKLRPKILIVQDSKKQRCKERIIDLSKDLKDSAGRPVRVKEVFEDGKFGINLQYYRDQGLKFDLPV